MSNFRLPTSGDTNWGSVLNAYIENLENKIKDLEREYNTTSSNSSIKNIGYASSGIVGKCECSFDDSNEELSFEGNVFISGDINTYYNVKTTFDTRIISSSNIPFFIYLIHNGDGTFQISPSNKSLQLNYSAILIGLFFRKEKSTPQFVPYYHSSLKTISELHNDIYLRRVDLESHNSFFSVHINDKRLPSNVGISGGYSLYCSGLQKESVSKFYSEGEMGSIYKDSISDVLFFKDILDETGRYVLTKYYSNGFDPDCVYDKGNYFRIMVDVFGHAIVQQAYISSELSGTGYFREQQVLNIPFNNSIFINDVNGDKNSLDASLWVEVARFGYNKFDMPIGGGDFNQDPSLDKTLNTFEKMTFVRSIHNGWVAQQSPRIWVAKDSQIDLNKTSFVTDANSGMGFYINYDNRVSEGEGTEIKIDAPNNESRTLLYTHSDLSVKFGYTQASDLFVHNHASVTGDVSCHNMEASNRVSCKNLKVEDGGEIEFTSDRRRKENFESIEDSYLEVVNKVPVMNYTYKNSIVPQVGIMAQDLEESGISNIDCFVKIEDSFELKNKRSLYETKLVYILWKALQEETELRKKLEKRVEDLEAK